MNISLIVDIVELIINTVTSYFRFPCDFLITYKNLLFFFAEFDIAFRWLIRYYVILKYDQKNTSIFKEPKLYYIQQ